MAISPIAATPPFALAIPSIANTQAMQRILALQASSASFIGGSSATTDSVALSQTSQLLSSVAEISDVANAAQTGGTVDNNVVVQDAQRFVDSVNALNADEQLSTFTLGSALDIGTATPATTTSATAAAETQAPGIDVVPAGDTFALTLNTQELQNALATNAADTTSQLAAFAVPLTNAVVQAEAEQQVVSGLGLVTATASNTSPTTQTAAVTTLIVPDLTVENAALRQSLADEALTEAINAATSSSLQNLATENTTSVPVTTTETATATTNEAATTVPATETTVPKTTVTAPVATSNVATPVVTQTTDLQAAAALALANQQTTPLEQAMQLALNPTVAGSVAAFQIPADDGSRGTRVGVQAAMDVVNPIPAMAATASISPNLTNSRYQR